MNELDKQKTFDLRCKAKSVGKLTQKEHNYLRKMWEKYPKEYSAMDMDIFNATKPFGAI